ncbi:transcription termination/antitermination protein NusG [Rhodopirellula europaea]|uniref:NusG antitermination factor n=2 Tax=Rhodopirellula europaea TaxID=1263866 RepID=M5S6X1_9BACT|nr:transcription termination/antitermination NusG family protein [Rhodopirellula europaea]EMB19019.1 NusG antitermination factor [Rhodopirellula europaea 6C]EMI23397.1 NusG antitermination factor [Rhodopirellula europaea SH398]
MPILPFEPDCYPDDLIDQEESLDSPWWLLYTKSRQEKAVVRKLRDAGVPHYAPMIKQRFRSPGGRMRESFVPLFSTYVFIRGDDQARYEAICTGSVLKASEIVQVPDLIEDLQQIRSLIVMGVPLTIESQLQPGEHVRVKNGTFAGYEGTVIRRENETRLLVFVRFMEQGVSVKLEDCQLEKIA